MTDIPVISEIVELRGLLKDGTARRVRESAGLSAPDLARNLGVSESTVWRWEAGDRKPRGQRLVHEYLGLLKRLQDGGLTHPHGASPPVRWSIETIDEFTSALERSLEAARELKKAYEVYQAVPRTPPVFHVHDADCPIAELGLPTRALNSLLRARITTIAQLVDQTRYSLLRTELGARSVEDIVTTLTRWDLKLADDLGPGPIGVVDD